MNCVYIRNLLGVQTQSGAGLNHILAWGEVDGCISLRVRLYRGDMESSWIEVDAADGYWGAEFSATIDFDPDAFLAQCGQGIRVEVECLQSVDDQCANYSTDRGFHVFPCQGPLGEVCSFIFTGSVQPDGECVGDENNIRNVQFNLFFSPAIPTETFVQINWFFTDGVNDQIETFTTVQENNSHSILVPYPTGGPYEVHATVSIPNSDFNCIARSVEFSPFIVQAGCTDVELMNCPTITLTTAIIEGCASDNSSASIEISAELDPATEIAGSSYDWKITDPDGSSFERQTPTPNSSSNDLWIATNGGDATLALNVEGTYIVEITANIPGVAADCLPNTTRPFDVAKCQVNCPQISLTASNYGCAPDGNAKIFLSASISPATTVTSYNWTVDLPNGDSATLSTIVATVESSSNNWLLADGSNGAIPLLSGNYSLKVEAIIENPIEGCTSSIASEASIAVPVCEVPSPPRCWWSWASGVGTTLLIFGLIVLFLSICAEAWIATAFGAAFVVVGIALILLWVYFCAPLQGGCQRFAILVQLIGLLNIILGILALIFAAITAACATAFASTVVGEVVCIIPGICLLGSIIDLGIVTILEGVLLLIYFRMCTNNSVLPFSD